MGFKIHNNDCLEYMKNLPDNCIDLIVTDPPYEIYTDGRGMYKKSDKRYVKELVGMKNGFSRETLDEMCRVMKKINCYIFCSQKQIIPLLDYFVKEKGCNWNIIDWIKSNPIPNCGNKYITDKEFILFFRERGVRIYGNYTTKSTYYITKLNVKDKHRFNHPTCKPVFILKNFIINSSNEGEIVFDPFMGSGSTGVAAIELNREFIGCEINEEYFNTANNRLRGI
jgi:DNA modification methylase